MRMSTLLCVHKRFEICVDALVATPLYSAFDDRAAGKFAA